MKRLATLCCALSLALASCGGSVLTEAMAEGPSTETSGLGTYALAARITDSTGAPVPSMDLQVVAQGDRWITAVGAGKTPVLARSRTDSNGNAQFLLFDSLPVSLEVDDSLRSGRLVTRAGSSTVRVLKARGGQSLRIQATVPGERILSVYLAGTGYRGALAADGSWQFKGVPRGTWSVVAATDSGLALLGRVAVSTTPIDTAFSADTDSVLVEDFAAPLVQNRYGALLGASWWFTATDQNEGGSSSTTPSDVSQARVPCEDGSCLSMDFTLDPDRVGSYAIVGTGFDGTFAPDSTKPYLADFTQVTHVRFHASGYGSLFFQLGIRSPTGTTIACHATVRLDSAYALLEVPISTLSCSEPEVDYRAVSGMTWTFTTDAHLTLGRVRLIGAGPRQVFPRLKAP